jgi:hypothetical protein
MNLSFPGMRLPFPGMRLPFPGMSRPFPGMSRPFPGMSRPFLKMSHIFPIGEILISFTGKPYQRYLKSRFFETGGQDEKDKQDK